MLVVLAVLLAVVAAAPVGGGAITHAGSLTASEYCGGAWQSSLFPGGFVLLPFLSCWPGEGRTVLPVEDVWPPPPNLPLVAADKFPDLIIPE